MIARLRLPGRPARAYCEADRWSFDPRFTQGRGPICGWAPEGVPNAPGWLALANRVDWDIVGLFLLVEVLFLLGLVVANAAGLLPSGHVSMSVPRGAHGGAANGVR